MYHWSWGIKTSRRRESLTKCRIFENGIWYPGDSNIRFVLEYPSIRGTPTLNTPPPFRLIQRPKHPHWQTIQLIQATSHPPSYTHTHLYNLSNHPNITPTPSLFKLKNTINYHSLSFWPQIFQSFHSKHPHNYTTYSNHQSIQPPYYNGMSTLYSWTPHIVTFHSKHPYTFTTEL